MIALAAGRTPIRLPTPAASVGRQHHMAYSSRFPQCPPVSAKGDRMKHNAATISRFRKGALYSSIIFLSISALLAIVSILVGDFGKFELKVLSTTSIVAAASICCLCCSAYYNRSENSIPGACGIILAGCAATMLTAGLWGEVNSSAYWKAAGILGIFAVASAHSLAILGVRLKPAHAWVQIVTVATVSMLAVILSVMILGGQGGKGVAKVIAVLAILAALETLVVPILGRLTRSATGQSARYVLSLTRRDDGKYQDPQGRLYQVSQIPSDPAAPAPGDDQ